MSWDSQKRAALHEAGHIIVAYVLSNKAHIAQGVGLGQVYNSSLLMTVWEGYSGPFGSNAMPSSDPEWVKAVAGFFAGKAAVATAIGRGLLPIAPLNIEQEPGDFGFLGGKDADQGRVQMFCERTSDAQLTCRLAWSCALITTGQYFPQIDSLSDWIVSNYQSTGLHMTSSPWTNPVIEVGYVETWLKENM